MTIDRQEAGLNSALGQVEWSLDRKRYAENMTTDEILAVLDYAAVNNEDPVRAFRMHYYDSLRPVLPPRFCETCGDVLNPTRRRWCGRCDSAKEWKDRWRAANQHYESVAREYAAAGFNRMKYVKVKDRYTKALMEWLMEKYERQAEEALERFQAEIRRGHKGTDL